MLFDTIIGQEGGRQLENLENWAKFGLSLLAKNFKIDKYNY